MTEPYKKRELDSSNQFLVGVREDRIVIVVGIPNVLTKERAVNLGCWLLALADPEGTESRRMTEAIKRT